MNLTQAVKQLAMDQQLDFVRIAPVERFWQAPEGHKPTDLLKGAQSVVSIGMRLLEGLRLRVKDVDFERREITVRDGKGAKDRMAPLPQKLAPPLAAHLERVRRQHAEDLRAAERDWFETWFRGHFIGFRLARTLP